MGEFTPQEPKKHAKSKESQEPLLENWERLKPKQDDDVNEIPPIVLGKGKKPGHTESLLLKNFYIKKYILKATGKH